VLRLELRPTDNQELLAEVEPEYCSSGNIRRISNKDLDNAPS
jgi:hypothetical protein